MWLQSKPRKKNLFDESLLLPVVLTTISFFTVEYRTYQNLPWNLQVKELSRKIFCAISFLHRLRNLLPVSTKIALAKTILPSILDYADTCYRDLRKDQLNKFELIQNLSI